MTDDLLIPSCPVHGQHTMVRTDTYAHGERKRYCCYECGRNLVLRGDIYHEETSVNVSADIVLVVPDIES